jgi:hypothetical protein
MTDVVVDGKVMTIPQGMRFIDKNALMLLGDGLKAGGASLTPSQAAQVLSSIAPASGHAQKLLNKLRWGGEAVLLVVGDSTGNGSDEWVRLFANWIAGEYPAVTVTYRVWGTTDYGSATTVQTGTGTQTLAIYNCSVSGVRPDYALGSLYAAAIQNVPAVDLMIVNHGHNIFSGETQDQMSMHWLELTEPFLLDHPGSGVILIAQNPHKVTPEMTKALSVRDVCAWRGFGFADVWSLFMERGNASSLYVNGDNIHPSYGLGSDADPTGTRLFLQAVQRHFVGAPVAPQTAVSLLSQAYGPNLLVNGTFSDYPTSPGAPTGWTLTNATATKDTTIKFGVNGYSVKLVGSGSGQPYMQQDLAAGPRDAHLGKNLILAVAMYAAADQDNNTARPALLSTSNGSNNYVTTAGGRGGWWWKFLPAKIGAGDTYIRARLFANTGSGSTGEAYIGAAVLRVGKVPSCAP